MESYFENCDSCQVLNVEKCNSYVSVFTLQLDFFDLTYIRPEEFQIRIRCYMWKRKLTNANTKDTFQLTSEHT